MEKQRRKFTRLVDTMPVEYKILSGAESEGSPALEGWTKSLDLSGGGMRLIFNKILQKGTKIKLKINLNEQNEPLIIIGHTVWAKPAQGVQTGQYEIGVEFEGIALEQKIKIIKHIYDRLKQKRGPAKIA